MNMPSPIYTVAAARAAQRLPILRRIPLARIVIAAELAMLAKAHYERLSPYERRRLIILLRRAKWQPRNMAGSERGEFMQLVLKLEPQLFAQTAIQRFAPKR